MEVTTKSVVVTKFGGYDGLKISKFKLPPLENDFLEVKVHYCGLNFADLYTRQGLMPKPLPFVLGIECCGVVTAVANSNKFKIGDKVICYDYKGGMYSDTVRISQDNCYILPESVTFEIGAAIFVNYLTAYFSVIEIGNLKPNQSILIQSCAGGVGWAATQLAKTVAGVTIYGTTSKEKEPEVKQNGVDFVLSYTNISEQLTDLCPNGVDLIIENVSNNNLEQHLKSLGTIVHLGANNLIKNEKELTKFDMFKAWWKSKNVSIFSLITNNRSVAGLHLGLLCEKEPEKINDVLDRLYNLLGDGRIQPRIHSVFEFEQIVEATKVLAQRKNIGKVLLKL